MTSESKNRGGRPARISRQAIIAEAKRLPAKDLSLSKIAKRLGVKAPAIYNHFSSRDDLMLALSIELASGLSARTPDPEHWREWMVATAGDLYEFYSRNPAILEMESSRLVTNVVIPIMEAAMETMVKAGFKPVDALLIWSGLVGFTVLQAQAAQIDPNQLIDTTAAGKRELAERRIKYPNLKDAYAILAKRSSKRLVFELHKEMIALISPPVAPGRKRKGQHHR